MIAELKKMNINYSSANLFDVVNTRYNENIEDENYYTASDIKDWYSEWDFKDFNPNIYSHGFHQYPAKFIPQLARKILRVFTNENSVVLDNFSGSGTTLIECLLLNRKKAIGIELNPFACFMAKVKVTPIDPVLLKNKFYEIENMYFRSDNNFENQKFHNIEFWFKKDVITHLSKLKSIITDIENENIKNFFLLCLSEVIRRVSLTNHGGFKLHRDKNKINDSFNPNVFDEYNKVCNRNINLMIKFYSNVKLNKTNIKIIYGDSRIRQNIDEESVDFILTSPPYGDSRTTVAYGQFSRLSWQWLNNDNNIYSLDGNLLGGKNNINLDDETLDYSPMLKQQLEQIKNNCNNRAKDVLSFYIDLNKTLINAYYYLKRDKYFVLVTGNRTVKNVFLRTDLIISELAGKIGFNVEKILYRNIINKRMPSKNSPTNEKGVLCDTMLKENIIFLRKK
ncbi:MAG TPA: DNA methyltransferase [Spirochaetota bacterium]|nr:DNA methyltransferase [Spirochaetota bacterium]